MGRFLKPGTVGRVKSQPRVFGDPTQAFRTKHPAKVGPRRVKSQPPRFRRHTPIYWCKNGKMKFTRF